MPTEGSLDTFGLTHRSCLLYAALDVRTDVRRSIADQRTQLDPGATLPKKTIPTDTRDAALYGPCKLLFGEQGFLLGSQPGTLIAIHN